MTALCLLKITQERIGGVQVRQVVAIGWVAGGCHTTDGGCRGLLVGGCHGLCLCAVLGARSPHENLLLSTRTRFLKLHGRQFTTEHQSKFGGKSMGAG